jgi:hypothetical protein
MSFKCKWNNFLHSQLTKILFNTFLVDFQETNNIKEFLKELIEGNADKITEKQYNDEKKELSKKRYFMEYVKFFTIFITITILKENI